MSKIKSQNEVVENRVTTMEGDNLLPAVAGPMEIMADAVRHGMGKDQLEILKEMFELDIRVKAQQAEEAYYTDMAGFKLEAPDIIMDKINKQTGNSKYSSTGNFLRTVNPVLAKHGLSARFEIDDTTNPAIIKVSCIISHKLRHSESSSMSAEPDTMGPKGTPTKTMIHGRMSTLTHLMRATFSAATGMFAIDSVHDDDGNAAGNGETINDEQFANLQSLISEVGADEKRFCNFMKVSDLDHLPVSQYEGAIRALEAKKK